MKKHIVISILSLSILIAYKIWGGLSLVNWINTTFMVGIVALIVTVTMNIWKTGFLSLFLEGFKRVGNMITPKTRSAERVDNLLQNDQRLHEWKNQITKWISYLCTNLAVISFTVSLLSLVVYYQ